MIRKLVILLQISSKVTGKFLCARQVHVQPGVICICVIVDPYFRSQLLIVEIIKAVLCRICGDLPVPLVIPVGEETRRLDQYQCDPVLFAQCPHLVQIPHGIAAQRIVRQNIRFRESFGRPYIHPHIITVMGDLILAKHIGQVFRRQIGPAGMIPQDREQVIQSILPVRHRCLDGVKLRLREFHSVDGHTVIGFALRFVILERQYVEYNDPGRLVPESIFQHIVRLPG